jgi:hypothetical protein
MPARSEGKERPGKRLIGRGLKAWRDDRERHSATRAEARANVPSSPLSASWLTGADVQSTPLPGRL